MEIPEQHQTYQTWRHSPHWIGNAADYSKAFEEQSQITPDLLSDHNRQIGLHS